MPAIQVYKANKQMIPVTDAKIAKAYQCPWTKEIYATKRSYVSHLKTLRTDRMHRNARQNRWNKLGDNLWNQPSFEKIIEWIELHPEWFLDNAIRSGWASDRARYEKIRPNFSLTITYLDLSWSDSVSNSHNCPHNGQTNWGGDKKDVPRGYPGWRGKIEYKISQEIPSFCSNIFNKTRIHTGTGGSGNGLNYNYSVNLFADDWPGVATARQEAIEQYEKDHLFDMIKNKYKPYNNNTFTYGKSRFR